ncbi:MAG: hypothetical protein ABIQ65_01525, partial [Thermoanaerobaculia bacterium]
MAGQLLADIRAKDQIEIEVEPVDPQIPRAFEIAGQGRLSAEVLAQLAEHSTVVYLHFPLNLIEQRQRLLDFTEPLRQVGGIAIKLESTGIAHSWERWEQLLRGTTFDNYCAAVVLVGDKSLCYSCGMHLFGLPECVAPRSLGMDEAADLMNRFNYWQILDRPVLADGHTFSLTESSPRFRLCLETDTRHDPDHLFHNPFGVWRL